MSVIDFVYTLSNSKDMVSHETKNGLAGLLSNIAVVLEVVAWNRILLKRYEEQLGNYPWLEYSEKFYWISRYSQILNRIYRVIGKDAVKNRLTDRQINICAELADEFKTLSTATESSGGS